ncbi:MAG: heme lyase CcmF/NrfE family subunit [Magnetococcales bacterium]|nr:heme lyase CcmF/NrfE family subunit [Magnetococcales bacterium]
MWIEIGHFAAILALLTTILQGGAAVVGGALDRPAWLRVSRHAAFAAFALLTLGMAGLEIAFLNHDFSVAYVANHASTTLPTFYLATALWGGHEGSLLLWAWLLSLFTALAAWRHWSTHPRSIPWVLAILAVLLTGFLLLILFLSSPFERLFPIPPEGRDLNPLLQDPGMVFHPPFLYLGYVGFAIPYAFAMAALITGRAGDEWVLATRRWTLFSWMMLTVGIVFGAYWAYYELGWGGYWAWDPVENASFMPWLTGTAFFHSVMVQERRGMFKTWNLFLITSTFALSLLGTFLVRSGVLSSVHAFANDPGRGVYILAFMTLVLLFSFGLLTARSDKLAAPARMESLVCRESAFLFNNLFFLVASFTVLLGTLYPLAIETLTASKVSVGAPYYNKVFIPIMLGMLVLMGVGPLLAWRRASWEQLRGQFLLPAGIGAAALVSAFVLGVRHPYAFLAIGLIFFVASTHLRDFHQGAAARMKQEQVGYLLSLFRLASRNRRRYGGLVVHFGILAMVVGFIGSGLFQEERNVLLKVGDSLRLGGWTLTLESVGQQKKRNWQALEAVIQATHDNGETLQLRPQKRVYNKHSQPTTEAAIHTGWREDLYVVMGDEVTEGSWNLRLYRNPLVSWIWWGTGILCLGVMLALTQGRRLRRKTA